MDGGKCRVNSGKLELSSAHEFGAVAMVYGRCLVARAFFTRISEYSCDYSHMVRVS